ncbi:MAG: 2-C-methyl-D-erythritol 4-phosphate cytidylyltransferase [Oscillospiraceae bacterium]
MIYAGIVAGGTGTRMGANIPKQFLELCGKPIIIHTIEKFAAIKKIDRIYIGVHSDWTDYLYELINKYHLNKDKISVICGGSDRNSTVFNIIFKIEKDNGINDNDIIITHDGVRPFITADIINDNIKAAEKYDACGTYISAIDTIVQSDDGKTVKNTLPRSEMYQAQTPQSFKITKLLAIYDSLTEYQKQLLTDTCSVFTVKSLPIHIVKGSPLNIKITTANDMITGEAIAAWMNSNLV